MAKPVGSSYVVHRLRASVLLTAVLSSLAVLQDCEAEGSTCTFDDAVPSKGGALLQHLTTRSNPTENTFPVHRHEQPQKKAMLQTKRTKRKGLPPLPANAKELFNQKLCGVEPKEKKREEKKQAEETKKGETHDYDDPGPDDTFPDNTDDAPAQSDIAEARAAGGGNGKDPLLVGSEPRQDGLERETKSMRADIKKTDGETQSVDADATAHDSDASIEDTEESTNNADNANNIEDDSEENTDADESAEDVPPVRSMPSLLQTNQSQSDDSEREDDSLDTEEDLWDPEKAEKEMESQKAPLTEEGFRQVCEKRSESEMSSFIRRVADSCNMKVIDEGGLNGAVGWFSNPDMDVSLDKLRVEMFKALLAGSAEHWVSVKNVSGIDASNAPLDMWGFVQVRALRKKKQTIKFVRRMVKDMGIKITDEDGFGGLMVYYSEPDDSQSFQRLVAEIKKATYEHSWAELD